MNTATLLLYVGVMAGATYFVRALPVILCKRRIKNTYILSLLRYVPYAALSAMTFPIIFFSTSRVASALAGFAAAVILAWRQRSLTVVALAACLAAYLVEWAQGCLF
ncbi:MAG: AzlD domain-containing protein [Peptococcaceae bacterium]|jgi:branched-subunit amino acid transport protein|nr:AzlD domain-containing protein [Peptococcaceae bacterium]